MCRTNADCTAKPHGRCVDTIIDGTQCYYDACTTDADCGANEVCDCSSGHQYANTCLPAQCQIDSDCGPSGYCSPSLSCDFYVGYFCHTPQDTCVNDSDCAGLGFCEYDATSAHWFCNDDESCEGGD